MRASLCVFLGGSVIDGGRMEGKKKKKKRERFDWGIKSHFSNAQFECESV